MKHKVFSTFEQDQMPSLYFNVFWRRCHPIPGANADSCGVYVWGASLTSVLEDGGVRGRGQRRRGRVEPRGAARAPRRVVRVRRRRLLLLAGAAASGGGRARRGGPGAAAAAAVRRVGAAAGFGEVERRVRVRDRRQHRGRPAEERCWESVCVRIVKTHVGVGLCV